MKKSIVAFKCPNCIKELEEKKNNGITEYIATNEKVYDINDVEIIEVDEAAKCSTCGENIKDISLEEYGDTPWHVFTQDGDPEKREDGGRNFRMSLKESFETFKEAKEAYLEKYKEDGMSARINLHIPGKKMIVILIVSNNGEESWAISDIYARTSTVTKTDNKPEGE